MFGLGARTTFQDIRDPGVTHACHGLRRGFPYVEVSPIYLPLGAITGFSAASPALVDSPVLMLRLILIADAKADADAVAGLLKVSLQLPGKMRQTSMRCRSVPIDVYIQGRRLITC